MLNNEKEIQKILYEKQKKNEFQQIKIIHQYKNGIDSTINSLNNFKTAINECSAFNSNKKKKEDLQGWQNAKNWHFDARNFGEKFFKEIGLR